MAPATAVPDRTEAGAILWCLARQARLIAGITLGVAALAGVAILARAPRYTATGTVLYDPRPPLVATDHPPPAPDNDDAIVASQASVIASEATIEALGDVFDERHARDALAVKVLPGSRSLTVAYTAGDPERAARAANFAMRLYIEHERAQALARLTGGEAWERAQLVAAAAVLDATEEKIAAIRLRAGVVAGPTASLDSEAASRAANDLQAAQADLAASRARLAGLDAGSGASPSPTAEEDIAPLQADAARIAARVDALARIYGPAYPDLAAERASLAAVQGRIAALGARDRAEAQGDVLAAAQKVALLTRQSQSDRQSVADESAADASIGALEQQEAGQRAIVTALTEQSEELIRAIALLTPDARILSLAVPPAGPDQPDRPVLFAAALVGGLVLGVLVALRRDETDRSIRSGGAFARSTGLPCLAVLPEAAAPRALPLTDPFSAFSEQIRALRTALFPAGALFELEAPLVVAFAAARPGEGKTTLAIALGRELAVAGKRVVVVDGDLRQPTFEMVFGLGAALGLTEVLAGEVGIEAVLRADPHSPLVVIAAGARARAGLSLFLSPALPALIATLRARFEVVILDLPPAFAVAEGRVLARLADSAVLCVRWADTPRPVVEAAMAVLKAAGVPLAGFALTRVNAASIRRSGVPESEIYHPRYGGYFRI